MRYLSIDILRGVAIILMIQVHFVDNLSSRTDAPSWLDYVSSWLGLIPAPLFTFVSGVSYGLWLRKQEALHRNDDEITKITMRRGLFLFAVGIAFNVLVWLPEDTFDWDILTLIGTALVLLAYARKLPPAVLGVICACVLLISPVLRAAGDFPAYWEDYAYTYDFNLSEVLWGFFANAYFPLFPWIIFPFLGFIFTDAVFAQPGRAIPFPRGLAATGLSFMGFAVVAGLLHSKMPGVLGKHYVTAFTMIPASTTYVLGTLGLSMASLVFLHRWVDQNDKVTGGGFMLVFLQRYSAFSLTVYVLHHMVHLWPLWIVGTWEKDDPTYYWRIAMGTTSALALAALFIVACYFALIFLERHGRYGLESLMRWLCE